jgi:hypothetical protein
MPGLQEPKEPAMTPAQDQETEVTRLRRTFRVAVVAAAVGAAIGAGVIVTVVGAVYSIVERPAAEARKSDTKAEKSKTAAQKITPQEAQKTPPAEANAQPQPSAPPAVAATPRRVEEPPAPREASCQDQTWPYLDGKCLTPADDSATRAADTGNGPASAAAPEPAAPAATTATAAPAPAPPASATAAGVQSATATTPETTGSATQSAVQPATAVATTGAAPPDTPAELEKKPRKKSESARGEQQKHARPDDKGRDRRLVTRGERDSGAARGERETLERRPSRDAATQSSRSWGTRAIEPDDEATPRTRTLVVVPSRSQADVSEEDVVTTRRQRRSARSRPDQAPRVEEREILRRDTSGEGSRDFFGGLFGGERD